MLNISYNKSKPGMDLTGYESGKKVLRKRHYKTFNRLLLAFSMMMIIVLFLPWTQNVSGDGFLTTLKPDHRPQTIQSPIPGRIEEWYVREGDFVQKGDTILRISEVKSEYFDPDLVARTGQQIDAKTKAVSSYQEKVKALNTQISALTQERQLKLQQARNKLMQAQLKVQSDSVDLEAAETNLTIAERQYNRTLQLEKEGLKAVTDVEEKRLKLQAAQAKRIAQQNKLLASKNEIINARVEINRVQAEYTDKISKARSDKFTAQSNQFDSEAQVTKLENQYTNYEIRNSLRYLKAPQSGYVNRALQAGIGETFKEGSRLVSIMPAEYDMAVEAYIAPIDLPLIHVGEKARIQFDGWPAIIFSGWPNMSYGTFGAKIVAIETFIGDNGKYRVLLAPDENDLPWPKDLRVGSGAFTMALLEDVPIWFEMWRRLNGFPPNYYQPQNTRTDAKKK